MISKNAVFSAILFVVSSALAIAGAEVILRVKNSSMKNYDIEMWRYAKTLKFASQDPVLGHEHVKNDTALLQSVTIRTNEWGLRGGAVRQPEPARRILFLGGSITLGWGVEEEDTVTARLEKALLTTGQDVEVLNGGVGNYNAERYVERFFLRLTELRPTDIVVQYFLRDAEKLDAGGGNLILRHSELAVTLWIAGSRLFNRSGEQELVDHYTSVYRESEPGYQAMLASLKKLADYALQNHIRLFLAMTPDVHNLKAYHFTFIHERMQRIAQQLGYTYVDLFPAFGELPPQDVWAMPGDPHPNALGHELMAKAMLPVLTSTSLTAR
jgi:lysophospholipase L1-like esterase